MGEGRRGILESWHEPKRGCASRVGARPTQSDGQASEQGSHLQGCEREREVTPVSGVTVCSALIGVQEQPWAQCQRLMLSGVWVSGF